MNPVHASAAMPQLHIIHDGGTRPALTRSARPHATSMTNGNIIHGAIRKTISICRQSIHALPIDGFGVKRRKS